MNIRLFLSIVNDLDKFNLTMAEWDKIDEIKNKIVMLLEDKDVIIENLQKELKLKKFQEEAHVETILQLKDENEKLKAELSNLSKETVIKLDGDGLRLVANPISSDKVIKNAKLMDVVKHLSEENK